jgi:L-aminopeptidase/D-esterase-like protein
MSGGVGVAHVQAGQVRVMAMSVVNAYGDVLEHGKIIAGAKDAQGHFLNISKHIQDGSDRLLHLGDQTSTTLVTVVTNASMNQKDLCLVSKMGSAGIARTISPAFTPWDGDIIFSVSLGPVSSDPLTVGSLAAEATRLAIINAVHTTEIL